MQIKKEIDWSWKSRVPDYREHEAFYRL